MRPRPQATVLVTLLIATGALGISACGSSGPALHSIRRQPELRSSERPPPEIPPGYGALVGAVISPTQLRGSPDGRVLGKIGLRTQFGSPDVLSVAVITADWLGVISELAGNGHLGWVPRTSVALARDPYSLRASLGQRMLTVLKDGQVLARFTIGIGAAASPTPTGRFAVTDRLTTDQPQGPYGCCILALSATAPHAIAGWTGGDRIAIHATPATETIGQPDSHGCIHVTQIQGRWLIDHVPDGTPMLITG
jgi:hypothetical protein